VAVPVVEMARSVAPWAKRCPVSDTVTGASAPWLPWLGASDWM
jgi:hypothetical protein